MRLVERLAATGKRFYCIAFSVRSGSTLLCEDMAQWHLGEPTEYFQLPAVPAVDGPFSDHVVRLVEQAPGELFGFKIAWEQKHALAQRLRHEGDLAVSSELGTIFPQLRYISMVRRDKVAQAVSAWRAVTSDTWHWPAETADVEPGRPPYDFLEIRNYLLQILAEDWLWESYLSQPEMSSLTVEYETYIEDRNATLESIAQFLEVQPAPVPLVDRLRVMRDDWSANIVERVWVDLQDGPPRPGMVPESVRSRRRVGSESALARRWRGARTTQD
jgi:LPS sulfotransferase NodH